MSTWEDGHVLDAGHHAVLLDVKWLTCVRLLALAARAQDKQWGEGPRRAVSEGGEPPEGPPGVDRAWSDGRQEAARNRWVGGWVVRGSGTMESVCFFAVVGVVRGDGKVGG
jgi:hypothetical protein